MAGLFIELKWTPQYLKRLTAIIPDGVAAVRVQERIIQDIFVKKAKMPRLEFIAAYAANETRSDWLDQYLDKNNPYSSVLKEYEKELRKARKILVDIEVNYGLTIGGLKDINRRISIGEAKARRAKKEMIEANLRLVISIAKKIH